MDAIQAVFAHNFPGVSLPPAFAALLQTRRLRAGATVFLEGTPAAAFYAVIEGRIEARLSGVDGSRSVLEQIEAPRLFGLAAFVTGEPTAYEAVALEASRLLVFGAETYRRLMDEVPGFARALLAEFARRFDGNLRLLQAARHRGAEERLQLALSQLARERGRPMPGGRLELRVTQQELALRAHLSRQTVNELLRRRRALGWRFGRGWLLVPAGAVSSPV
jgi:CRP-like cAMP-binding protein